MPVTPFDHLALAHPRRNRWRLRVWREWCFLRVLGRHFALRAIIMLAVLNGGALLFKTLGPERDMPYLKALWSAWLLIFAETPPYDFPDSLVLDLMYFVMPILGLTVIIEGIIDFALVLRDRKRSERSWCVMMASQLRNHIVLVGFGKLGYSTYLLLRRLGESVVVVERDPNNQFFEELRRDGVPLLIGDARRDVLLGDANVADAVDSRRSRLGPLCFPHHGIVPSMHESTPHRLRGRPGSPTPGDGVEEDEEAHGAGV